MNLSTIVIAPHAEGFIKVACEDDPLFGEARTKNEFLITARHHESPGEATKLAPHPIRAELGKAAEDGGESKVTEIPIRLFFNKPTNALSIRYQAYEAQSNRPVCSGDGKNARRLTLAADNTPTFQELPCPGPDLCDLVTTGKAVCRRQVRMSVQIQGQSNPLSVFEVRTSSLNTYRALRAQLQLIDRQFGGLRHVPLKLTLWRASNELSNFEPFSLMQLQLDAKTVVEAMKSVKEKRDEIREAGLNDDIDSMLVEGEGEDPFVAAAVDFPAVSEFYSADAGRRSGAEPITSPARAARAAGHAPLATVASNSIAEAVNMGAATAGAET